jgi:hypothetical protein
LTTICATTALVMVCHFDPRLFDLLYDLAASLGSSGGKIDVVCGYRTPWSNEFRRTRSQHSGVARHSLHMQAEAIDIRFPGIPTSELREAALHLHRGGVAYYRSSDFVHVDVGGARKWLSFPYWIDEQWHSSLGCAIRSVGLTVVHWTRSTMSYTSKSPFVRWKVTKLSIVGFFTQNGVHVTLTIGA